MAATSTAIEIANAVSAAVGIAPPSSLGVNADTTGRRLTSLMNVGGAALAAKRGIWNSPWPALLRKGLIVVEAGRFIYPIPQDFSEPISGSFWSGRSILGGHAGPASPQYWAWLDGTDWGSISAADPKWGIVFDPAAGQLMLRLDQDLPAGTRLVYRYSSTAWVRESADADPPIYIDRVSRGTNIPVFPAYLMELDLTWRHLESQGQEYRGRLAEFEAERDRQFGLAGGAPDLVLGRPDVDDFSDPELPLHGPIASP